MRLQTRLILYSTLLILFLMVPIVFLVEKRQTEIIMEEARKRGMAIAKNLAAVSTNALLTYNYVVLQQNGGRVAQEEDIVYVIIHDKENRVAIYSGHDEKQGMLLADEISQKALRAKDPLIQSFHQTKMKKPILDLSIPVYIKESAEKWGTVRIGLSLERMYDQISRTRMNLLLLGGFAILLGILGSIFFARRITRPISKLVETTISAARGNLDLTIDIRTGDEIEELGHNFSHMIGQIRLHRAELEKRLREITSLKAYADHILASMTNGLVTATPDCQYVFVDLPGYQTKHLNVLNRSLNRQATEGARDCDVVVFVVEATRFGSPDREVLARIPAGQRMVAAVNKIDLVKDRLELLPFLERLQKERDFAAIVPVSASKGTNLPELLRVVAGLLPRRPGGLSRGAADRPRRALFRGGNPARKTVPASGRGVALPLRRIAGELQGRGAQGEGQGPASHRGHHLDRAREPETDRHWRQGRGLKRISTAARKDMESLFGGKVYLGVWVKVKRDWTGDERLLRQFGYR